MLQLFDDENDKLSEIQPRPKSFIEDIMHR